jgi:hypothetical protein
MVLINTDGMAFIGPGSEWFWTAISGIVLAVTFIAIYRQLRLQRSAGAIEQHSRLLREWHSEPMLRNRLAALTAIRDGAEPGAMPDEITHIGNFWEGVSFLVRSGHVDRRLVYSSFGGVLQGWWTWLSPTVLLWRAEEGDADILKDFEWLTRLMADLDRKAGNQRLVTEAYLRTTLPSVIEIVTKAIRTAEAMRSIIVEPASKAGRRARGHSRGSDVTPGDELPAET